MAEIAAGLVCARFWECDGPLGRDKILDLATAKTRCSRLVRTWGFGILMHRFRTPILALICLTILTLACHGRALLKSEQFAYRDAAHFYYPLYERVEQEWNDGKVPLWEPEENAGMPLLGNPTAAVLYPGKLIFRICPSYALGARLYVVAHTILAFAGMFLLLTNWKVSGAGCILGSLAYAFGGPILFQYCNIIYLVGAAWLPFGMCAVDRWLRLGDRLALLWLAVSLAMEVLGGDPEIAYLTGLFGGAYALGLAFAKSREERAWPRTSRVVLVLIALFVFWVVASLVMARVSFLARPYKPKPPIEVLPWMPYVSPVVAGLWGLVALFLLRRFWKQKPGARGVFIPMLAGMAGSAILAAALSSAQLLPVLEFTAQSGRAAGEGTHDIYPFSLEPIRCVEFFWPNVFGTPFQGNRSWFSALPTPRQAKVWVPTLYIGGLTLVLAIGTVGFRRGPSWRAWMSGVALLSLLLSFGEYTGPLYWARFAPSLTPLIGVHDTEKDPALRFDRHLRDGDGSLYWIMATGLPGFRQFRFPSKLLTFTVLALSALAAGGFDRLLAREGNRRTLGWIAGLLAISIIALTLTWIYEKNLNVWLSTKALMTSFGPVDIPGAISEMRMGLIQGSVVLAIGCWFVLKGHRHKTLATVLVLGITTLDLAHANARYVLTLPQSHFDQKPEVLKIIEEAEKSNPSDGPFRVHRMSLWNPYVWTQEPSDNRVRDFVNWERGTLQPKYGITYGLQYTMTLGVAELYDYQWFFGAFERKTTPENATFLNVSPGTPVVVYPRRAFDIWNTRYFVLPYYPAHWSDEHRGYGSMLPSTDLIYPKRDRFKGPDGEKKELDWTSRQDFQIRRNRDVFPRAWVVRSGRFLKSMSGLSRADRDLPMQEILFSNEPLWRDETRTVYDPREVAWVDVDHQPELAPYLAGGGRRARDSVKIASYESQRVELDVDLEKPGFVVLAEVFYPGWKLTIDGVESPIYRANRMMRGAAVKAGKHRLVYTFEPKTFLYGKFLSLAGLASLGLLGVLFLVRPTPKDRSEVSE